MEDKEMMFEQEQEIDLRDYVKVIAHRWRVIAGITLISVLVTAGVVLILPRGYESVALLELANVNREALEGISIVTTIIENPLNPHLREIARKLEIEETEENILRIAESFEVEAMENFIQIRGEQGSPTKAKELVEILSGIVVNRHDSLLQDRKNIITAQIAVLEEQLTRTREEISTYDRLIKSAGRMDVASGVLLIQGYLESKENARRRYNELFARLKEQEILVKYQMEPTKIIGSPVELKTPVSPKRTKIVIISFVISLMFSVFLVFLMEYFTKKSAVADTSRAQ